MHPRTTRIRYFAPSTRVVRRLIAYGVPKERITLTGFPLPHELLGGPRADRAAANLVRRLARLDGDGVFRRRFGDEVERTSAPCPPPTAPPRVAFAVGGAGAQAELAASLPAQPGAGAARRSAAPAASSPACARRWPTRFRRAVDAAGLGTLVGDGVDILHAPSLPAYFRAFNAALADADALWTKPSELTFFAALGLGRSSGARRWASTSGCNARWAMEAGAGLRQHQPEAPPTGSPTGSPTARSRRRAWSGFRRCPSKGSTRSRPPSAVLPDRLES